MLASVGSGSGAGVGGALGARRRRVGVVLESYGRRAGVGAGGSTSVLAPRRRIASAGIVGAGLVGSASVLACGGKREQQHRVHK